MAIVVAQQDVLRRDLPMVRVWRLELSPPIRRGDSMNVAEAPHLMEVVRRVKTPEDAEVAMEVARQYALQRGAPAAA